MEVEGGTGKGKKKDSKEVEIVGDYEFSRSEEKTC